jgi:methyl-accepting chemotaxis protein
MTGATIGQRATNRPSGRRASTDVAIVMIAAALVSALVIGVFNYVTGRQLIRDGVTTQLVDVGANRADRIERGLANLTDTTVTLAREPSVAASLVEFSEAFAATTDVLDDDQLAALTAFYADGIAVTTPPGVEPPTTNELLPSSDTARFLQYWYVTQAPLEERGEIVDPGDGSVYSAVHAQRGPELAAMTDIVAIGDVVLIDLDGTVVYSSDKRIDFATNLVTGPHRDSGLAEAVARLETSAAGDVVFADYASYAPALGLPELWVATVVRNQSEVVGIVATSVGNDALVALTTAGGDWDALGLGDTGETYIVGPDRLLRSESRLWLEDPDRYLDVMADAGFDQEAIDAVSTFDTTVLTQIADTDAVDAALGGEVFEATTTNYLGQRTRTYSEPLRSGALGWVVVTEAQTSEIFSPLRDYVWRLFLVALLAVPIVIGVAVFIARRMLRPIGPIVDGANTVAGGDIDVELDMGGHDEFSDIAAQFNAFVAELRRQRGEVERADAETTELLASVLPRRLVDQYRSGDRDIAESIQNATLIAITLNDDRAGLSDDDRAEYSVQVSAGVAEIAARHEAEHIASNATTGMYATGLGSDQLEIDDAIGFAIEARDWIQGYFAERELDMTMGVGVAGGDVVANVIGTQRLAFDVLGSPRRIAEDLARAAPAWAVVVDAVIAARTEGEWAFLRMGDLIDPRGAPIEGWLLEPRIPAE